MTSKNVNPKMGGKEKFHYRGRWHDHESDQIGMEVGNTQTESPWIGMLFVFLVLACIAAEIPFNWFLPPLIISAIALYVANERRKSR